MSGVFLTGAALLVDGAWLDGHGVLVEDGRIVAVLAHDARVTAARVALPPASLLAPGLIDIQVNGGGGVLFNDAPGQAGGRAIAAAHRALGTTSVLPTLITDTAQTMRKAADVRAEPGVLGVHFEGPFLNAERAGVHRPELIRAPCEGELALLEDMAVRGAGAVVLTVAPEAVTDAQLRRLATAGVILCAGHSAASYERVGEARAAGVIGFTHLFNAMPPMAARAPGIAAAALDDSASWCGVIADGIHVHPALLRLLLAAKPARTMLVSDAMPPAGTDSASFVLQGREILRHGGSLRTADGTLAGADICLADAVRFCVRMGVPAARALHMASAAPAGFLRLEGQVGRIAPGLRADLVLLTPALEVLGTWLAGAWEGEPGVLVARAAA